MTEERDERLIAKAGEPPMRGAGRGGNARGTSRDPRISAEREAQDRTFTEDRELSEEERLEMFRAHRMQSILPDLPEFHGYHVLWLTTSNPRDSIPNRLRLGYELITLDMCPGWDGTGSEVNGLANVVSVNEMVAARIPIRLYNLYMRDNHHIAPLEEEDKLRKQAKSLAAQAERLGSTVEVGDGVETLAERVATPQFAA